MRTGLALKQYSIMLALLLANLFSTIYNLGISPKLENCECNSYSEEAICSALSKVIKSMNNFYFVRYLRGSSTGDVLVLLSKDGVIPFIA